MADKVLEALSALVVDIPIWISDLEDILRTTSGTSDDCEALPAEQVVPAVNSEESPEERSKSTRSRGSTNCVGGVGTFTRSTPLIPRDMQQPAAPLRRKRKVTSEDSDAVSWTSKRRARNKIVVYYDGKVQRAFETTVDKIAWSRHAVGKFKVTPASSAAPRGSDRGTSEVSSVICSSTRHMPKRARVHRSPPSPAHHPDDTFTPTRALNIIDTCLEEGSSLCERAAYQMLREGECALEVSSAMDCFEEAKKLAEEEIPGLRAVVQAGVPRLEKDAGSHSAVGSQSTGSRIGEGASPRMMLPLESSLEVDSDDSDGDSDDLATHLGPFQTRREGLGVL